MQEDGIYARRRHLCKKTAYIRKAAEKIPLLGESHHGGSATRKRMKMATPLFVAGLIGVIPAFREGIFEVG